MKTTMMACNLSGAKHPHLSTLGAAVKMHARVSGHAMEEEASQVASRAYSNKDTRNGPSSVKLQAEPNTNGDNELLSEEGPNRSHDSSNGLAHIDSTYEGQAASYGLMLSRGDGPCEAQESYNELEIGLPHMEIDSQGEAQFGPNEKQRKSRNKASRRSNSQQSTVVTIDRVTIAASSPNLLKHLRPLTGAIDKNP